MKNRRRIDSLRRASIKFRDVVAFVLFVGVGMFLLVPTHSTRLGEPKRVICASNLRGIGQGMHIYAEDNSESFPMHYFESPGDEPGSADGPKVYSDHAETP